jgi:putative transposase
MGLRKKQLYHDKNIFFITTTCYNWLPLLTIGDSMQIISESLNFSATKYGAMILGYVLMPNHIHLIVHFVSGKDRVGFMRDFKSYTSLKVRQEIELHKSTYLQAISYEDHGQQYKIWQDRFDELYLESRNLLEAKLEYTHNNPLQNHWNLVKKPSAYLYSSAMYYEKGSQNKVIVRHYRDFV